MFAHLKNSTGGGSVMTIAIGLLLLSSCATDPKATPQSHGTPSVNEALESDNVEPTRTDDSATTPSDGEATKAPPQHAQYVPEAGQFVVYFKSGLEQHADSVIENGPYYFIEYGPQTYRVQKDLVESVTKVTGTDTTESGLHPVAENVELKHRAGLTEAHRRNSSGHDANESREERGLYQFLSEDGGVTLTNHPQKYRDKGMTEVTVYLNQIPKEYRSSAVTTIEAADYKVSLVAAQRQSMKFGIGQSRDEMARLLGPPDETEMSTCGSDTDEPWQCLQWNYAWPTDSYGGKRLRLLYFQADDGEWYLNSWNWF